MKMKIQQKETSEERSIQPLSNIKKMKAVFFASLSAFFFYMLVRTINQVIQENHHGVMPTNLFLIFLYGFIAPILLFMAINAITGWFDSHVETVALGGFLLSVILFVMVIIEGAMVINSAKDMIEESAGYSNVEHIDDNKYYGEKDGKEFYITIDQKDEKLFITSVDEINEESTLVELTRE